MALPSNFNEWINLREAIQYEHNKQVRKLYSKTPEDDVSTPKSRLKHTALIKDSDSSTMVLLRLFYHYFCARRTRDLVHPVYGSPLPDVQAERRFKPQVFLYFLEDLEDVEPGFPPVAGEITFRLMDQDSNTISMTEIKTIAQKVKSQFAMGSGRTWKKGKEMASYTDKKKGYQFQLLVRDKSEAKSLITDILQIQSHTPDWENLNYQENDAPTSKYPTVPGKHNVLGKLENLPRRRPIAEVRFQYALLHLHGSSRIIPLCDRSYTLQNPVV
ncbi:MAG: hypothetical protein VKJ46_15980 [Leptolyngbyaceae bacterium]|nr:hypothetical protein [Leptolyngbyaceae bacterium]